MFIKPPLILLIFAIAMTILSIYNTYRMWFKEEKVRKEISQSIRKMPGWYPLRGYWLRRVEKSGLDWEGRIVMIIVTLVTIGGTVFLMVAYAIGV